MDTFEVGDVVECIDDELASGLTAGHRYVIAGYYRNLDLVKLKGSLIRYNISRFRRVSARASEYNPITRPPHYTRFEIEPLTFIMANNLPFWLGNVIKYGCRYDAKDGLQDLKKARQYLDVKIAEMEDDTEKRNQSITL